jgi:hypothetical protein
VPAAAHDLQHSHAGNMQQDEDTIMVEASKCYMEVNAPLMFSAKEHSSATLQLQLCMHSPQGSG